MKMDLRDKQILITGANGFIGGRLAERLRDEHGARVRGLRLAVLESAALEEVREAPRTAFEGAVERLLDAGAEVHEIRAPEVAQALALSGVLFTAEAYGEWRAEIEAAPGLMFPQILERFRAGAGFSGPDFVDAWNTLRALRARWNARMAGYDAVLLPTSPILPPDAERLMRDEEYYVTENLLALRNTRVGNLIGTCGVSLPTGVPSCGLMMLGKPMGEERLLRVAAAAEAVL